MKECFIDALAVQLQSIKKHKMQDVTINFEDFTSERQIESYVYYDSMYTMVHFFSECSH